MSTQNLISATMSADVKEKVLQSFATIKRELDFLISLPSENKRDLYKIGPALYPFIDKAYYVITNFPDILPRSMDIDEFKRDYKLAKDLSEILHPSKEINDGIQASLFAANSDSMATALDVYAIVQMYKDKVPGLNVVAIEMAEFFKKTKRKKDSTEEEKL